MKKSLKVKISIDILMTLLLLFLMGYQFWGDFAHEWAGTAMFVLFLAHHILNRNWYRNLFRGKYSPRRVLQLLINIALTAVMAGMMVSGIMLSRHVFTFLSIQGGASFARILHMVCAYWGYVLMALHLGLHFSMILQIVGKRGKNKQLLSRKRKITVFLLATGIAAYGASVFIRRRLMDYMLIRTQFVFLNFGESKIYFYAEYLCMMGFFIYIIHYAVKLLQKTAREENPKSEHL